MNIAIFLLFLLVFAPTVWALEPVKIAYPSTSYTTMPIVVGLREGFFDQEALSLKLIRIRASISITALINGEIDFTTAQGSVVRAAARGIPVKSVAILADRPAYFLVAKPGIASMESLKGTGKKIIGVNSLGGSIHIITKEILIQYGVNPDKDVAIIVTGDQQTSLQAVQLGRIDATLVSMPWQSEAKKLGFNILAYTGEVLQMPLGGIGTTESLIQRKADLVKKVIRATLKGTAFLREKKNKKRVVEAITQWFGIDEEIAKESYDQMILVYPSNGTISPESLRKDVEIARTLGSIQGDVPLSQVVDFRLLREVQKELGIRD
jgi:ABC-type nitrate/sulfonate/bicarbonate transport system substrate-binding protein